MNNKKGKEVEVKTYNVKVGRSPRIERIDAYLSARFPEYSRTFVKKLIRNDHIKVDGKPVKPSYTPAGGDQILIEVPVIKTETIPPEKIDLEIIYEDEWILVINKPPNMVVHPSRGHQSGTLVNAAAYHCKELSSFGGDLRPGIVHRLDKDTTGVIIMVKDDTVHEEIAKQFEKRTVEKEYFALCKGRVELDADMINAPIGKHNRADEKMAVRHDCGKPATTVYKVAERIGDVSFVRCFPHSGRTHQIRVHMHYIGHPILCDANYGHEKALFPSDITGGEHYPLEKPLINRQALHAARITIFHPGLGRKKTFEAPMPADMRALLDAFKGAAAKKSE